MSVLFSDLLIPGWAEGEGAMIGLDAVTGVYGSDQAFTLPCHTSNPEIFFSDKSDEIAYAKSLCGACPVKKECLQGALSRKEPCGIWGGELFEDGVVIAARRLPGRPKLIQEVLTSKLIDEKVLVATA
jgi:WhiB family redox-sensing transcriptional regulator